MKKEPNNYEVLMRFLIVMIIMLATALVIDEARSHGTQPPAPAQKGWQPPEIPDCDKELWLRIKDKCPEDRPPCHN